MLPSAMSRAEILREIVECPRHAYVPMPDLQVIERAGWRQLLTPSLKRGGMNEVSLAQVEPDDVDRVIDETHAQYREIDCQFTWRLGPDSSPALVERLAQRGLAHTVSHGMARSTDLDAATTISVERVAASTIDAYTRTMAEGWSVDAGPLAVVTARVVEHGAPHHLFLARVDGEPAATASAVLFPRSIYLLGGVTLPRFRGRGAYRALVAARMAFAHEAGVRLATSHARSDTSAPILERLGFETLCRFDNFTFVPSG